MKPNLPDPDRRRVLTLVGAGIAGATLLPGTAASSSGDDLDQSPFEATVACDGHPPAELTVRNTSHQRFQLRDIDGAGVNAVAGRPMLEPNETYTKTGVPNGTAVLQAYDPHSGRPAGPRLRVAIDCAGSAPTGSPFTAAVACDGDTPAVVTVTNASSNTYELRDIDGAGVNAVDGRPVLGPGESYSNTGVPNGTAVLQAYDSRSGKKVGPRLTVTVDCGEAPPSHGGGETPPDNGGGTPPPPPPIVPQD